MDDPFRQARRALYACIAVGIANWFVWYGWVTAPAAQRMFVYVAFGLMAVLQLVLGVMGIVGVVRARRVTQGGGIALGVASVGGVLFSIVWWLVGSLMGAFGGAFGR